MIMNQFRFDEFIDKQNAAYGLTEDPPYPANELKHLFSEAYFALGDYWTTPVKDVEKKILWLKAICSCSERYLRKTWSYAEYAGRIAAMIELHKQAGNELKLARSTARNNWLKLLPQKSVAAINKAKAVQNWDNLKKITSPQPGKKLNNHYWKEIFDPSHRPPYSVDHYDDLFDEWLKSCKPFLDANGTVPNPNYDPGYRQSFFDYLDTQGNVGANFQYEYLSRAERATCRILLKDDTLVRKCGGKALDTSTWQLNNGLKQGLTYEGSSQSMLFDHGIWVASPEGEFYSGPQRTSTADRHHSALLGGAPIKGGGEWLVKKGKLLVITGSSGHYTPNFEQFQDALRTLATGGIRLNTVAAEWPYKDTFTYFNAKQLALPSVKAAWNGWPKFDGRPLRPVRPLSPSTLSAKPIPADVGGNPYWLNVA